MDESITAGHRLRTVRKQQGLSADDLAARVGISPSAVRNQENGTNGISATRAAQYAEVLGLSPQWLLYGDGAAQQPLRVATHRVEGSAVVLFQMPNGKARLQVNKVMPYPLALKVLAMIEEDQT